jgi:hypothetical protein
VQKSWTSLLAGASGIVSTIPLGPEYAELPSTVAAMVPRGSKVDGDWDAKEYLKNDDTRKMAGFSQFAVVAAEEALADSGWNGGEAERERAGVCIGSGIGSFHDAYDTTLAYHKGVGSPCLLICKNERANFSCRVIGNSRPSSFPAYSSISPRAISLCVTVSKVRITQSPPHVQPVHTPSATHIGSSCTTMQI